jgi:hypothetical protein
MVDIGFVEKIARHKRDRLSTAWCRNSAKVKHSIGTELNFPSGNADVGVGQPDTLMAS